MTSRGMTTRKRRPAAVVGLALALGSMFTTAACSQGGGASKGAVIGVVMPLSGPSAAYTEPMVKAIRLAVDQANASGDLPSKVKLDIQDDQSQPELAASLARKMCGDSRVVGVIANLESTVTLASQPVYNRCGLLQIAPSSTNDDLTTKGYDNFFMIAARDSEQIKQTVAWITRKEPTVKSVVTVDANDASTTGAATKFAALAAEKGLKVQSGIHITSGQNDFRAALTSILNSDPDLIYLATFYNDGALIVKQARELGYKGEFFGSDANISDKFGQIAGAAADGVHLASTSVDPTTTPTAKPFVQSFTAKYSSSPTSFSAQAFDAANVILAAWKAMGGGSDRTKLIDRVRATDLHGATGEVSFDEHGNTNHPTIGIMEVHDSRLKFIGLASDS